MESTVHSMLMLLQTDTQTGIMADNGTQSDSNIA